MRILNILLLLLVVSCSSNTTKTYIKLDPAPNIKSKNLGNNSKISLSVSKIKSKGFPNDSKQLGYKMREILFNSKNNTAIYSDKKLTTIIEREFHKWLTNSKFNVVNNRRNKEISVKLGYFYFQPIAVGYQPKIRIAIKVYLFDKNKKEIFSKWYFYEKNYKNINKNNNEDNINNSITEILNKIFSDDNLLYLIKNN